MNRKSFLRSSDTLRGVDVLAYLKSPEIAEFLPYSDKAPLVFFISPNLIATNGIG